MARVCPAIALCLLLVACGGDDDAPPGTDAAPPDTPDAGCAAAGATPEPGLVITSHGPVRGVADGATWAFRGIPYAQPPTDARRFAPPEPLGCFPGAPAAFAATDFGARCPQRDADGVVVGAEDCLTLNVWVPQAPAAVPRPVMVFIHGGGNVQGSSAEPVYDGDELATSGGVVVITINYRLGALGFLAHPALAAERPEGVSGNWGILDQIAALAWVRDEIAAFGGDPARVTIFGESAGARDVCVLLASPRAAGLFHGAIMQSGGCTDPTEGEAESFGAEWAAAAGCAGAADLPACLRGLDLAEVMATLPQEASVLSGNDYQPNVDGAVLPEPPIDAIAAGRHNAVPFMVGANADETGRYAPAITTEMQYQQAVQAMFPLLYMQVLAQYPAAAYPTPRRALVALTSDARFICPSREVARAGAAAPTPPVWRYFFTHPATPLGAVHGIELVYVFGTFESIAGDTPSAADLALATALQGYWTRFAATGDPNGDGAPVWPAYDGAGGADPFLDLAATPVAGDGVRTAQCDFWEALLP
jgi:para-nitrobenzyl esterase